MVDVYRNKHSDDTFIDSGGNLGGEKCGWMLEICKHEQEHFVARTWGTVHLRPCSGRRERERERGTDT